MLIQYDMVPTNRRFRLRGREKSEWTMRSAGLSCEARVRTIMCHSGPRVRAWFDRRAMVRMSMEVNRLIGSQLGREFFSLPAWEMLLELYAREDDSPVPVKSLCLATKAPDRTAQHAIERLVEQRLLIRSVHPTDRRFKLVSLSADGRRQLDACFDGIFELTMTNGAAPERCAPAREDPDKEGG